MNPELSHVAARCHYRELLAAAQREHRFERVHHHRSSNLARAIASMRFSRRRRALAVRTAVLS